MSTVTLVALLAAVVMLAANAFFVAAEFALVASRAVRLEAAAEEGDRRSRIALAAVRDIQTQLAGAQLGITMASLLLGYVAEPAIAQLIEPLIEAVVEVPSGVLHTVSFALALFMVTTLHVIVGEMVPKNVAITEPEKSARLLAPALRVYGVVFRPVIWTLNKASNAVVRLMGMQPADEINTALTINEFHTLLAGARSEGVIEPAEHDLLSGALGFRVRSAGSMMVPADRLVSAPRGTSVARLEEVMASTGHSRVPVWGSDKDDVLGFVHAKDLIRMPAEARDDPVPLELLRRMRVVGPDMPGRDLLLHMRRARVHMAVVRGDAGRMLGVVTLEDVLESLVGEIFDESDTHVASAGVSAAVSADAAADADASAVGSGADFGSASADGSAGA
ncbi:MAG: hemolysin family protein [Acidimicrobiaceae bacterium]|nr:hemolysin family protein [Acidimicrobiaceae bacterium]MCY4176613.1 hemolysin family protein [Acidimicrobiaceae bacterium]MCY4280911.1 hemolysin family protein [Acidimicrobiaceae bacterium]MCY4295233.1 hemolysin family protein [Acidimicrobiaceae bacterium]